MSPLEVRFCHAQSGCAATQVRVFTHSSLLRATWNSGPFTSRDSLGSCLCEIKCVIVRCITTEVGDTLVVCVWGLPVQVFVCYCPLNYHRGGGYFGLCVWVTCPGICVFLSAVLPQRRGILRWFVCVGYLSRYLCVFVRCITTEEGDTSVVCVCGLPVQVFVCYCPLYYHRGGGYFGGVCAWVTCPGICVGRRWRY